MNPRYFVWTHKANGHACLLGNLKVESDLYPLHIGIPQATDFPDDANFCMHPDFPFNTILKDNLENTDLVLVVSKRLKDFVEAYNTPFVEYLPVTIFDHKHRPVSGSYFILHPTNPVDCLNVEECGPTWSEVDPNNLLFVERLAIHADKIPLDRTLFRPFHFVRATLIRSDLASAIQKEGFTGLRWIPIDQYPED